MTLLSNLGKSFWAFLCSSRGGSPVEYAVFAGLTIGLALFGSELLGVTAKAAFAQAATAAGNGTGRPQARLKGPDKAPSPAPPIVEAAGETGDSLLWLKFAAAAVLLAAGGAAWWLLYARRRSAEVEEEAALEAALPARNLFRKRQDILKILADDMSCLLDNRVSAGQLMSTRLTTVPPATSFQEVEKLMAAGGCRHLLVVDAAGKLLGVISDRDVAKKKGDTAGGLMTANPIVVERSTLIGPAVTLLLERRFSCLPVVEHGQLLGVLTTSDLIMALQCSLQLLCKIAMATRARTAEDARETMAA